MVIAINKIPYYNEVIQPSSTKDGNALQPTIFNKRIYTLPAFTIAIHDVLDHIDDLRAASRGNRINRAFAEKIMLTVTRVNGCRYCNYGHSRAALAAGVSETELQYLLSGELGAFPEHEAVALAFAQHYAESNCRPDPSARERLLAYYGPETSRDILAYLRMITLGNLYGNTFDAILSRLAGKPAARSRFLEEIGVILGAFVIIPFAIITRSLFGRQNDDSK
jgi:AhpD family alkylhydroperoxidase